MSSRRRFVDQERARMELGLALHDLRVSRGWTLAELEDKSGVALSSLSAYERGTRQPSLDALIRILDTYDVLLTDALAETYPFGRRNPPRTTRSLPDRRHG
jgi:transcriptional regulator with XRE-family HTH domain